MEINSKVLISTLQQQPQQQQQYKNKQQMQNVQWLSIFLQECLSLIHAYFFLIYLSYY